MKNIKNTSIGVIGLGYVGLPLSIRMGLKFSVIGYDIDKNRIQQLKKNIDTTNEITKKELINKKNLIFTNSISDLNKCNFYIVTLPTPINNKNKPDLSIIKTATKNLSKYINKNDIIVYESTVYPGVTEEICAPIIEKYSGLKFNKDFFCGYSPERINPGDKEKKIHNIKKVVSGSTPGTLKIVNKIYSSVISAGTHKVSNIKIAEAAKVIENTQRDLNIALINEISMIFESINIDMHKVLKAAKTKWNFIPFTPGLVGGHCIGVDPYYLTYLSEKLGHKPKVILAGRKINNQMHKFVSKRFIDKLKEKKIRLKQSKILIMGYTFKENCPDTRNTKIKDLALYLKKSVDKVDIYDPWVNNLEDFSKTQNINFIKRPKKNRYDGIIIAVGHSVFKKVGIKKVRSFGKKISIIFDFKKIYLDKFTDL